VSGSPTVLIMAAGKGTRMRSSVPKMLHPLLGRPLVSWPVAAASEAGAARVVVIVGPDEDLSDALPAGTEVVVQAAQDGTGGAIRAAIDAVRAAETVIVLSGDHPLVTAGLIDDLARTHSQGGAAATVVTTELDEPGSYGRIVRDNEGDIERIVEAKSPGDATDEELAIREINTGTYAFDAAALADALGEISADNSQEEYYLGDVLPAIREAGLRVTAMKVADPSVNLGVNTRADLALVTRIARERVLERHMLAGVTVTDPGSTWIDADVTIGEDATIEPYCFLRAGSEIGPGAVVGPMTTLIDTRIGAGATVTHSYLSACDVLQGCQVGPFAHIRPGSTLREGAKAGGFVEIKNSDVGAGAKVPHLSYIGDADVGDGANIGAGTITANYDGFRKHRTVIGDHVRIGVDTSLIAPVNVGDGAYTGAGSVIVDDVPPGALGVARPGQTNVEGYAERKAQQAEEESRT
jgi:bifunctional UDP-N-acetylglucosamine pyrophosphorylase / glucosamine-1-phosphate N-acetyltransferase